MKTKIFTALAVLGFAITLPVLAHHSFAAEFDASKAIRLSGTLTKIEWTNPHSYFYIDVKNDNGQVENWACEGDGSRLVDARRVTLPDGRNIYGGTPGDGGPGDSPAGGTPTASKP